MLFFSFMSCEVDIDMQKFINTKLEQYGKEISGKLCAVIGVGVSNLPLIDFLLERGARVVARDKKDISELLQNQSLDIERLSEKGVRFVTGEGYLDGLCEDIIFKTPGIRCDNPKILDAYLGGAVVTSEMETFLSLCPAKIIAVTGSDGKTTTTTLISKILSEHGHRVFVGGNIGRPLLCDVPQMNPDDFAVLELSSFQLHSMYVNPDGTKKDIGFTFPDVAVVTNVSPNHLDWHTSYDEYVDSKKMIFSCLSDGGKLVTNAANADTVRYAELALNCGKKVGLFSAHIRCDGYYLENGVIYKDGKAVLPREKILLQGIHNVENYMAAISATEEFVSVKSVERVAESFGGVAHRLEYVRTLDGVLYYNSSIDSSPSRSVAAINGFPDEMRKKLVLIMGGYDKKIPYDSVGEPVCRMARAVFLCGATSEKIRAAIESAPNYCADTQIFMYSDFEQAVIAAKDYAVPGDRVILTPASASFDMFKNFEQRGERFKQIVNSLGKKTT